MLISNSTQTLDVFEALMGQRRFTYRRLDGSMTPQKRQDVVDAFNSDESIFIFLLSSKAGGCGINLIGANRLVLFDPDWNPATDQQALARVWRSGQQKPCYVYRFFAVGSLEEVCYERQCSKEGLSSEICDGDGERRKFSGKELDMLFTPNFHQSISNFHDRSKCCCCAAHAPYPPPPDPSGFIHLRPGTSALQDADACLARAAETTGVTLALCKVTDESGRGFGPQPGIAD